MSATPASAEKQTKIRRSAPSKSDAKKSRKMDAQKRDRYAAKQLESRCRQARLAMEALSPQLSGLSLKVAAAVIKNFPEVKVPSGTTRTAAAATVVRESLTSAEANRKEAVSYGISCARFALRDAYAAVGPQRSATA